MQTVGIWLRRAIALSMIGNILVVPCFAADCGFLAGASALLSDRALYYQVPGTGGWARMDDSAPDLRGRVIKFTYVIVENFAESRAGVLILKSGRTLQISGPSARATKSVKLVRRNEGIDNGSCGAVPTFGTDGTASVPSKSYDDYHDRGLKVPEAKTLKAFHFKYAARRGGCRRTNDDAIDSVAPPDLRSNLSQFSFDSDVVAHGTYSQVLAWFRPTSAYASSDKYADQRVEMKQYRSIPGKPVCIQFNLAVDGAASFLRINDLESLKQNGVRFVRSDEQGWSLSH